MVKTDFCHPSGLVCSEFIYFGISRLLKEIDSFSI